MLESRDDLMSIVVLEAGATWPSWLTEYQRLAPNAVVIAQAALETAQTFRSRVIHRIEEARAHGALVRVGVLVAAPTTGDDKLELRQGVACALLHTMGAGSEAELVLAANGGDDDPARHDLFALAGALCEELGGTKVNVRVRFSNDKSGVMRAVSPSSPDAESTVSKGGA